MNEMGREGAPRLDTQDLRALSSICSIATDDHDLKLESLMSAANHGEAMLELTAPCCKLGSLAQGIQTSSSSSPSSSSLSHPDGVQAGEASAASGHRAPAPPLEWEAARRPQRSRPVASSLADSPRILSHFNTPPELLTGAGQTTPLQSRCPRP